MYCFKKELVALNHLRTSVDRPCVCICMCMVVCIIELLGYEQSRYVIVYCKVFIVYCRASAILAGLAFTTEMQSTATK